MKSITFTDYIINILSEIFMQCRFQCVYRCVCILIKNHVPKKELLTLELNRHMIFNEDTDTTINALEATLHKYLG